MKNRKFKIGDKVLFEGVPHTIVAYSTGSASDYTIKGPKGFHNGSAFSVLEDGSYYKSDKRDCTYKKEEELTLIENKMEKGTVKLSLEDAKKLYEQDGNFRTIALSAYSEEELVFTPKDGDFITLGYEPGSTICIFKTFNDRGIGREVDSYYAYTKGSSLCFISRFTDKNIRLATEEEKQLLLEAMHKEGKDWDSVNKKVIPYRWRAEEGGTYYYVDSTVSVNDDVDFNYLVDKERFNKHNYFKTEEEAQKVADKINRIFEEL